jgi:hypothetical protein
MRRPPGVISHEGKRFGILGNAFDESIDSNSEFGAEPRPPIFVPDARFNDFDAGLWAEIDAPIHS